MQNNFSLDFQRNDVFHRIPLGSALAFPVNAWHSYTLFHLHAQYLSQLTFVNYGTAPVLRSYCALLGYRFPGNGLEVWLRQVAGLRPQSF